MQRERPLVKAFSRADERSASSSDKSMSRKSAACTALTGPSGAA
eukprot:gene38618-66348_t